MLHFIWRLVTKSIILALGAPILILFFYALGVFIAGREYVVVEWYSFFGSVVAGLCLAVFGFAIWRRRSWSELKGEFYSLKLSEAVSLVTAVIVTTIATGGVIFAASKYEDERFRRNQTIQAASWEMALALREAEGISDDLYQLLYKLRSEADWDFTTLTVDEIEALFVDHEIVAEAEKFSNRMRDAKSCILNRRCNSAPLTDAMCQASSGLVFVGINFQYLLGVETPSVHRFLSIVDEASAYHLRSCDFLRALFVRAEELYTDL